MWLAMSLGALQTMAARTGRVIRLDATVFREVALDGRATYQALAVVFLGAISTAVALQLGWSQLPAQLFLAYVGWITGSLLAYAISRYVFRAPREAHWSAVARAVGFAHAPLLLRLFAPLPAVGLAVLILTTIWQGAAMLTALKEVVGYPSYWRPMGVVAVGFGPYVAIVVWFTWLLL